jgi:hypothetical protein
MAGEKLYDNNTSFQLLRTNPKLSGNFRITVDSENKVWLNSLDVNTTLSNKKYKKYEVTGKQSYASDVYNFFQRGTTPKEVIFESANLTDGERESTTVFGDQYDFFYGSGASTLIDKNYPENFRYFAPLWVKDVVPDYFVIFKVPDPLSFPYTTNVTQIEAGKTYKIIQSPDSSSEFTISYGVDLSGNPVVYSAGQFFTGLNSYPTYQVTSGSGNVALFDELAYYQNVTDVESFFQNQILPNAQTVATFDLREQTTIGSYIRSIIRDQNFNNSPITFGLGNSYTYWNGVNLSTGVLGQKGEILDSYLQSTSSIPMIDFEATITGGFERNSIVCANLLNLEFYFDDVDSDFYSINRYFGFYVSRNDTGSFKMNGDFFFQFKNDPGNLNLPKPSRNSLGYYYNNVSDFQSSTGGVRLYYEGATGWIPGSLDVNSANPEKIFYITDKFDRFYSLQRTSETPTPASSAYGAWWGPTAGFGTTGYTGATSGTLVIGDQQINLLDFTGPDEKLGSFSGQTPSQPGCSYISIGFNGAIPNSKKVTFKITWPDGSRGNLQEKYDLVSNGDFSGSQIRWIPGDHYSSGNNFYFNGQIGAATADVARSLSGAISEITQVAWASASVINESVTRLVNPGSYGNSTFKVSVHDDYESFSQSYLGDWNSTSAYPTGSIVLFNGHYWQAIASVPDSVSGNIDPDQDPVFWTPYYSISDPELRGLILLNGMDALDISGPVAFKGGTDLARNRIVFSAADSLSVKPLNWVQTTTGFSIIEEVVRYVDSAQIENGFLTGWNGYDTLLVAILADTQENVSFGSTGQFNVFKMTELNSGVFTFFDVRDFDFDFHSSEYSSTPTPEIYRYFQLSESQPGNIIDGVKYLVQSGEITYNGIIYPQGRVFIGSSSSDFFTDNVESGPKSVVVPAEFTKIDYTNTSSTYPVPIDPETDLGKFPGFLGIESISGIFRDPDDTPKEFQFLGGKIPTEYDYLEENYTTGRANFSRIVPIVNKWVYTGGTDSRGNGYRLNVSPAFSPTNFSPSIDKETPDPNYLTHEWFVLEGLPHEYPLNSLENQNFYLPNAVDLDLLRSADPANTLYFSSAFTAVGTDYPSPYGSTSLRTKEFFSPVYFNRSNGFYETLFRGVKIQIKKRSSLANPTNDLERYIPNYRGYENYKFSALLRVVEEDVDTIQSPVGYEVIENSTQMFILLVCTVTLKDYRAGILGSTGATGNSPYLDHVLMYSLIDKKRSKGIGATAPSPSQLFETDDIKLSVALDLSVTSGSSVTSFTNPGTIFTIPNADYDTDLREEINLYYPEGASSIVGSTGPGSFSVPLNSSTYPWPIGRSLSFLNFGPVNSPDYEFGIPFSPTNPATIPLGSRITYAGKPVYQISGGENYFNFLMRRISVAEIARRFNGLNPYIKYNSYSWDPANSQTLVSTSSLNLGVLSPSYLSRNTGLRPSPSVQGPSTLGVSTVTSYNIVDGGIQYASDLARYSGGYEPLTRKVILFKNDKTDTIVGYPSADLSFRNCTFAPEQNGFGLIQNLSYTKVSENKGILDRTSNLPEGAVYPLVGLSPIARKNFSIFQSSWDPGYYNLYSDAVTETPVAGTRSMKETNSFFGSKMMKTPDNISATTFITLPVSRTEGNSNVDEINAQALAAVTRIQNFPLSESGSGIGQLGTALVSSDLQTLDQNIFPDVELFYQLQSDINQINGVIRLDRILRRFLLNSGIGSVFIENIISEFGVGNPNTLDDDIRSYITQNINPIYTAQFFNLYVKKVPDPSDNNGGLRYVVGDLLGKDRYKEGYQAETGLNLVKRNELVYTFTYDVPPTSNWSLTFSFGIEKI